MVNELIINDFYPPLSVKGSVGQGPNKYLSSKEGNIISTKSKNFIQIGIKNIIESNVGIKSAECRIFSLK